MRLIDAVGELWFQAHHGVAILDHAEQHLRDPERTSTIGERGSIQQLRSARTDLKAAMEYLDGIAEIKP